MKRRKKVAGFSITEVMLSVLILGLITVFIMQFIFASNRNARIIYLQHIAETMAQEPIEIFQAMGFAVIKKRLNEKFPELVLGKWQQISELCTVTGLIRPSAATLFERKIQISEIKTGCSEAYLIKVIVKSGKQNSAPIAEVSKTGMLIQKL